MYVRTERAEVQEMMGMLKVGVKGEGACWGGSQCHCHHTFKHCCDRCESSSCWRAMRTPTEHLTLPSALGVTWSAVQVSQQSPPCSPCSPAGLFTPEPDQGSSLQTAVPPQWPLTLHHRHSYSGGISKGSVLIHKHCDAFTLSPHGQVQILSRGAHGPSCSASTSTFRLIAAT